MVRKKVKLESIANDATRRATLIKRRKGLVKKVKELSILCDVGACIVIYSPHDPRTEVWPSVLDATRVLSRFLSMSELEKSKKMMNQETFLRQRVAKLRQQLRRHDLKIRELEFSALLRECMAGASVAHLGVGELATLAWLAENKEMAIQERIDRLRFASAEDRPMLCDANCLAVNCFAGPPQPDKLQLTPSQRPNQQNSYQEMVKWLAGRRLEDAVTVREHNGQQIAQFSSGGGGRTSEVVGHTVPMAEGVAEQSRTTGENFLSN